MTRRVLNNLKIVSIVHIIAVFFGFIGCGWRGCVEKEEPVIMPIEFVVELPASPEMETTIVPDPDPVIPDPESVRKVEPAPKPEPKPKPKPKKKSIERGKRIVRKPDQPSKPKLTQKEIEELLAKGARPSNHTSIPGDDGRCKELIRRALYSAWTEPGKEEAGNAVCEVSITLDGRGRITARSLARKSGNAVLDSSVLKAVNTVQKINGLSVSFLNSHKTVTISFRVE